MEINRNMRNIALFFGALLGIVESVEGYYVTPPAVSRATNLPNKIYDWRGQKIRYQVAEPRNKNKDAPNVLLVHGLFVNSDHWRKTLSGLSEAGYRVYAMDMLGCGYSSKPHRDSPEAQLLCGERARFKRDAENGALIQSSGSNLFKRRNTVMQYTTSKLENVPLGTASGATRLAHIELRHPLASPYNFYTWADQIADFCSEVIDPSLTKGTTLVSNSVGVISSLQAAKDYSELFNGVFIINPNFRELHASEMPLPRLTVPFLKIVQCLLRTRGQSLFDAMAKPKTVAKILREPYKVHSAIDEELVDVLLSPLLTKGAADVVFDTLSYSSGPLPEQILGDENFPRETVPVWVCYGKDDPWTPNARVERLIKYYPPVEKVVGFDNVGHCPHDESPELVNPLLVKFLERIHKKSALKEAWQREFEHQLNIGDNKTWRGVNNRKPFSLPTKRLVNSF